MANRSRTGFNKQNHTTTGIIQGNIRNPTLNSTIQDRNNDNTISSNGTAGKPQFVLGG